MAKQSFTISQFSGGISEGEKIGIPNSFRFAKAFDIHEDPSYLTPQPVLAKVSGETVADLVKWAVDGSPYSTDRYFYGDAGKIYKETSAGSWSLLQTTSNSSGNGLCVFDDYLYYSLDAELGRYGLLSGTPAFDDAFLSDGTFDKDQSGGGTGAADYVPPTTISEVATARQTFTPAQDPLKAVIIDVDVVGSGNWTVTVHDQWNTSIGSKAIANGSMSTGDVTFTFATPLRVTPDVPYHFHVTSSAADGGVDTDAATDLEGAEFQTLIGVLVTDADWHPMIKRELELIIGNEQYLAVWDQSTYNASRIRFERGFRCRDLKLIDEFIVAACWKGSTIDGYEEGRLYFWDGLETGYNFAIPIYEGLPNAIGGSKNRLVSVLGSKGDIYFGGQPFEHVQGVPKLAKGKKIEVYPGAISNWQGKMMIGFGGSTDDSSGVEQGVYSLGSQSNDFPEVLTYDYVISTGTTQGTTLKIGAVCGLGADLYVSWQDGAAAFGVDKVSKTSNAATASSYEDMIFDNGKPYKEKQAIKLVITFEALASGESVTPKFKSDRADSFTTGDAQSTVDATKAEYYFDKERFKEIEIGFDAATATTFYKVTSVSLFYDDLEEEKDE